MPQFRDRIHSLDILRGLAALSVVFWHWQHFFFVGGAPGELVRESQPLYPYFSLFYRYGGMAVELFFSLSGFVFCWLFSRAIAQRELPASRFFIDRFSRLYPLHFATFLIVLAAQALYRSSHDSYFVYQENDAFHALLNLLLIPAWGLERGWSFNAPIWSVSVEVLLYAVFFVTFSLMRLRLALIPLLILLGYYLPPYNFKVAFGLHAFFCGAAAYLITRETATRFGLRLTIATALTISLASWYFVSRDPDQRQFLMMGVAFPSSIALLALLDRWIAPITLKFAFIGNLSYSSYLLHFPLQLAFAMAVDFASLPRSIFLSSKMLALFFIVLIPLCLICHRYFEAPLQKSIRNAYRHRHCQANTLKETS
ncbi:acyltransferase family protein [Enterobacterales bacterium AE_CKDN230030158-1A_HGKHYDSX7]